MLKGKMYVHQIENFVEKLFHSLRLQNLFTTVILLKTV